MDNGKNLANNAKEEENDSHIHSISSTRNMGNWSNLLGIHDLPSIDPLQEANIILSLNVSTVSKNLLFISHNNQQVQLHWNSCYSGYQKRCLVWRRKWST